MAFSPLAVVIGGTGFVGSHVVNTLLSQGYSVRATTRDPTKAEWLAQLGAKVEALALSPESPADDVMDNLVKGAQAVFFCAGFEKQEPSTIQFMVNNAKATVAAAKRNGCEVVVLTSSGGSTNPPGHSNETPKNELLHWSDPDAQESAGKFSPAAKTRMEIACLAAVGRDQQNNVVDEALSKSSPRLCIMNPNLILGPQLQPGEASGNSLPWIKKILLGQAMQEMPNDSMSVIDVRDLAALHVACAKTPTASGRYFGVNKSFPWEEILAAFKKAYPKYNPPARFQGDANTPTQFDVTRRDSLGLSLKSLDQTIEGVVDFMIQRGLIDSA